MSRVSWLAATKLVKCYSDVINDVTEIYA